MLRAARAIKSRASRSCVSMLYDLELQVARFPEQNLSDFAAGKMDAGTPWLVPLRRRSIRHLQLFLLSRIF